MAIFRSFVITPRLVIWEWYDILSSQVWCCYSLSHISTVKTISFLTSVKI